MRRRDLSALRRSAVLRYLDGHYRWRAVAATLGGCRVVEILDYHSVVDAVPERFRDGDTVRREPVSRDVRPASDRARQFVGKQVRVVGIPFADVERDEEFRVAVDRR